MSSFYCGSRPEQSDHITPVNPVIFFIDDLEHKLAA
jgi:hypothetical protein